MRPRHAFVLLATLALAACDGTGMSPTEVAPPAAGIDAPEAAAAARSAKVDICHLDDYGLFRVISVAAAAEPAHMGHGDRTPIPGLEATLEVLTNPSVPGNHWVFEITFDNRCDGTFSGTGSVGGAYLSDIVGTYLDGEVYFEATRPGYTWYNLSQVLAKGGGYFPIAITLTFD